MNTFEITGMTCDGCRKKVEATLRGISGEAVVTLDPPRVVVAASIDAVNDALARIGKYRALNATTAVAPTNRLAVYYPLFLVMALIAVVPLATGTFMGWMMGIMAGFYIVFGAFKLLDVPAFANAYAQYDVIAKSFKPWGYAYPFIEVALGFGFLFWLDMRMLSWVALILSVIGIIGALNVLRSKQTIQCACLGTVFNLPMSVVTVVENLGMAMMAAWMLLI